MGLKKAYTTTPELSLALKMLPATAFSPVFSFLKEHSSSLVADLCCIDTICYSGYYNLILCVFQIFQKIQFSQKLRRIESPSSGAWITLFLRDFSTFPRPTRFFQTLGSWNLCKPGSEYFGFPSKLANGRFELVS